MCLLSSCGLGTLLFTGGSHKLASSLTAVGLTVKLDKAAAVTVSSTLTLTARQLALQRSSTFKATSATLYIPKIDVASSSSISVTSVRPRHRYPSLSPSRCDIG